MDQLKPIFELLNITFEVFDHIPITTVQEAISAGLEQLPGIKIKNLVLTDKSGNYHLFVLKIETKISINQTGKKLGITGIKMANQDEVYSYYNIGPGALCPFVILNDKDSKTKIYLDSSLKTGDKLMFHPLQNNKSILIIYEDLIKFCKHYKSEVISL